MPTTYESEDTVYTELSKLEIRQWNADVNYQNDLIGELQQRGRSMKKQFWCVKGIGYDYLSDGRGSILAESDQSWRRK